MEEFLRLATPEKSNDDAFIKEALPALGLRAKMWSVRLKDWMAEQKIRLDTPIMVLAATAASYMHKRAIPTAQQWSYATMPTTPVLLSAFLTEWEMYHGIITTSVKVHDHIGRLQKRYPNTDVDRLLEHVTIQTTSSFHMWRLAASERGDVFHLPTLGIISPAELLKMAQRDVSGASRKAIVTELRSLYQITEQYVRRGLFFARTDKWMCKSVEPPKHTDKSRDALPIPPPTEAMWKWEDAQVHTALVAEAESHSATWPTTYAQLLQRVAERLLAWQKLELARKKEWLGHVRFVRSIRAAAHQRNALSHIMQHDSECLAMMTGVDERFLDPSIVKKVRAAREWALEFQLQTLSEPLPIPPRIKTELWLDVVEARLRVYQWQWLLHALHSVNARTWKKVELSLTELTAQLDSVQAEVGDWSAGEPFAATDWHMHVTPVLEEWNASLQVMAKNQTLATALKGTLITLSGLLKAWPIVPLEQQLLAQQWIGTHDAILNKHLPFKPLGTQPLVTTLNDLSARPLRISLYKWVQSIVLLAVSVVVLQSP